MIVIVDPLLEIQYSVRVLAGDRQEGGTWPASKELPVTLPAGCCCSNEVGFQPCSKPHLPSIDGMYTIQLPKTLVVAFVALSSSLWFTSLVLGSGMIYGEVGESKLSVFDFVTGQISGLTEINWKKIQRLGAPCLGFSQRCNEVLFFLFCMCPRNMWSYLWLILSSQDFFSENR